MSTPDWDQRLLCPDGSCVGLIGPTGTCKVCGRVAQNWGDERRRGLKTTGEHTPEDTTPLPAPDPGDERDDVAEPRPEGWTERRLCTNGACIGLLDATGRCKVCGTVDESAVDETDDETDDEDDDEDDDEASAASTEDGGDEDEDEDDEDDDDDEEEDDEDDLAARKLCPDGACVGVIGPDNRCKICGKEAA